MTDLGLRIFSLSLCNIHSPTAILLSALNILLLYELVKQFLNSGDTNTGNLLHVRQRQSRLCPHSVKNLRIIWCSECYPLPVIPPYILIPLTHKQYIIINFSSHQVIEIFQERTDIFNIRMGSIAWYRANFKVCLMQRFQIFIFLRLRTTIIG